MREGDGSPGSAGVDVITVLQVRLQAPTVHLHQRSVSCELKAKQNIAVHDIIEESSKVHGQN